MVAIEVNRRIDAPRRYVFSRLFDFPNYSEWLPCESVSRRSEFTSDDPVGVGTTTSIGPRAGLDKRRESNG